MTDCQSYQIDSFEIGDVVIVRYYDALLFKDVTVESNLFPIIRETIGWLDFVAPNFIRIVWERHSESILVDQESRCKITGLTILKSTIIEVKGIE